MSYSAQEKTARAAAKKRTPAQGFGGQRAGRSSPSPSQPEPCDFGGGDEELDQEDAASVQGDSSGSSTASDLLNPQYWLQRGVQAGTQMAPLFLAGVTQGVAAQLALHPDQAWQKAIELLPAQPVLSLEQQQQQRSKLLLQAMQQQFGADELARLPDSMRGAMGLPALAEAALPVDEQPAVETTAETVSEAVSETVAEAGTEAAGEPEPETTSEATAEPQPVEATSSDAQV